MRNIDGLNLLLAAQLTHVPFEAMDVWAYGRCPSLAVGDLFDKIIIKRRGGYCFELNTLFRDLLESLGFSVYQVAASLLNDDGSAAPPAHNVIICHMNDTRYFLDVGFGGTVPFRALPLIPGDYDSFTLREQKGFFYLSHNTEQGERPMIRFRDVPAAPVELIPLNFYISQKPDVHFRHRLMVTLRREGGGVFSILGKEFRITGNGQWEEKMLTSEEELKEILVNYFGMDRQYIPFPERPESKEW